MKVKPRPIVLVDKVIPKKPVVVEKEEEVRLCIVLISQETKKTKHIISKCWYVCVHLHFYITCSCSLRRSFLQKSNLNPNLLLHLLVPQEPQHHSHPGNPRLRYQRSSNSFQRRDGLKTCTLIIRYLTAIISAIHHHTQCLGLILMFVYVCVEYPKQPVSRGFLLATSPVSKHLQCSFQD